MKKFLLVAAAALTLSVPATSAFAQQQPALPMFCNQTKIVHERLGAEKYQEVPFAAGLKGNGVAMVWANTETGTWTWTLEIQPGVTCVVLGGTAFEAIPAE
ncbi:MAG: hypothetical protein VX730_07085 [Pseudomonadota bacterium]|nr:hypothetical protein [Pseudomonadota bacterium]